MKKFLVSFFMFFIVVSFIYSNNNIVLTGGTAICKLSKNQFSGTFIFTGGEFQTIFQCENLETNGLRKIKVEFDIPISIPLVFEFKSSNLGKPNEVIKAIVFEKGTNTGFVELPDNCSKIIPYMHVFHLGYDDTLFPGYWKIFV